MTILYAPRLQRKVFRIFKFKNLVLAIILSAFSVSVKAQQKPHYSLLWKISGKGMGKPSYLFGTMHVKDKRVFGFSDSVMLAIQNCPSFALEIHPDTVIKQMFEDIGNKDTSGSLRKLLSKDDYEKFSKRFESKNGYPPGDIDPVQAESMMQAVKEKPDDKKAFVDAYLYGVARGLGKNIYGLEDTREQLKDLAESTKLQTRLQEIIDGDEQEEIEQTEEMIKLYAEGNIKDIVDYLGEDHLADSILVKRNHVMLNSIIKHMATTPIFSAVGVAHLPGDNGLIELLKKAGYSVAPVTANFTGIANKFNADYTNLKWKTYTDDDQGYSVDFPFDPVKASPSFEVKAVVFPDMGNEIFLGTYAILNGSRTTTTESINRIIKNLKENGGRIITNKPIFINGFKATEVVAENNKHNTIRYRFLANNNYLYCIYAGNDAESINSAYVNKFINSFKTFKPVAKAYKKWITYTNDTAAFSISLPMQPFVVKQLVPSPLDPEKNFSLSMYLTIDSANLMNYIVRYNDYPKGNYLANKTLAFESIAKGLQSKGAVVNKISTIYLQGYEGREIEFNLKSYVCRAQFFIRGNRIYLLLKQNLGDGGTSKGYDFFETFKLTPYAKSSLHDYAFKSGDYKARIFQDVSIPKDSLKHYNSYLRTGETVFSTNEKTGGVFGFEVATFSKYYRAANIDSAYSKMLNAIVGYSDSLIKKEPVTVNGLKGWEYIVINKYSKEKQRHRLFINNNDVITFLSHTAEEDLFTDASNEFYNSLIPTRNAPQATSLNTSKAELIINDLQSTDSTTYGYALGALSYYKFDKAELKHLLSAVQRNYEDDTAETGARTKLIDAIAKFKDPGILDVLVNLFNTTKSDYIKASAISAITKVDSIKGYDTYLYLLSKSPIENTDITYSLFRPLHDSVDYAAAHYPQILKLLQYPVYRRNVLSLTQSMLAKGYRGKYAPLVTSHFAELTQYATADLNSYLADTATYKWKYGIYNYLQLMSAIKARPVTDSFTLAIIRKDDFNSEVSNAVITRLDNKLPVNTLVINRLLDSASNRYTILEALSKNGKLALAPLKYRSQLNFAKTSLYAYVQGEDEGAASKITLLGIIPENENQYYVFKFNTTYNEDSQYTAVCGPYKTGSAKLDFSTYRAYTDWENKKMDWRLHTKKMIPELKKANKTAIENQKN